MAGWISYSGSYSQLVPEIDLNPGLAAASPCSESTEIKLQGVNDLLKVSSQAGKGLNPAFAPGPSPLPGFC